MNNEPVAWMWSEDGCNMGVCLDQDKQIGKQEFQDYSIPLYTHPAKDNYRETHEGFSTVIDVTHPARTLTDEEIVELTPWKKFPYESFVEYTIDDVVDFARAILRKAQEK